MKLPKLTKLFGAIFGPRKQTAEDQTATHTIEYQRLIGDESDYHTLPKETAIATSFTEAEKNAFYAAREALRWLPAFGPNGCWLQSTADRVTEAGLKASRQYVDQVLWPRDPKRIFTTRTPTYKAIWAHLAALVTERLNQDPTLMAYMTVMDKLDQGITVWVRSMRTSRLTLLSNKCVAAGLKVVAYSQTNRTPYDYLFVPEPIPVKDRVAGSGSLKVEEGPADIIEKIRTEHKTVELIHWNRAHVDTYFDNATQVSRLGSSHYMVELAA